jgi:hypothetical protein
MWVIVHSAGHTWLSASTDVYLFPLMCEQFDRLGVLLGALETDTMNRVLLMSILEDCKECYREPVPVGVHPHR